MPPPLNLKELLKLVYNAGRGEGFGTHITWDDWWETEGRERHDRFLEGSAEGDRTVE